MSAILVGYDGSEGSRASLERAIDLAGGLGDTVKVVFGAAAPGVIGGEMSSHEEAMHERGVKVLEHAADQARGLESRSRPRWSTSFPRMRSSPRHRPVTPE